MIRKLVPSLVERKIRSLIGVSTGSGGGGTPSNWIMATGNWNDAGVWNDSANWVD
tara:strand:- start:976 stop:1140 length:165 start_codon:yes stop_codon:yes gene_type:complete